MIGTRHNIFFPEELPLSGGDTLPAFDVAYEKYGELNSAADNAILVCHSLTMGIRAAGERDDHKRRGWWDKLIGPGKPFDTDRFCIICSNVLGGCDGSTGPASFAPKATNPYGLSFPVVTISDMVNAQARLADHMGIDQFFAVAGGCFGGMQALEWMANHPHRINQAIVIDATPRVSAITQGLWSVMRRSITLDPNFNNGNYYDQQAPDNGMKLAMQFTMMMLMNDETIEKKLAKSPNPAVDPQYTLETEFPVEHFLDRIGSKKNKLMDPNSFIYLTRAMDYFDLTRDGSTLAERFAQFRGRTLLVSNSKDKRYPPEKVDEIRVALEACKVPVHHEVLDSSVAHGAFMYDIDGLKPHLDRFLST